MLWRAAINPLVLLLTVLTTVSFATEDFRAGRMMLVMIVMGVRLKLIQEARSSHAAAQLRAMISVTATVIRNGKPQELLVSQVSNRIRDHPLREQTIDREDSLNQLAPQGMNRTANVVASRLGKWSHVDHWPQELIGFAGRLSKKQAGCASGLVTE